MCGKTGAEHNIGIGRPCLMNLDGDHIVACHQIRQRRSVSRTVDGVAHYRRCLRIVIHGGSIQRHVEVVKLLTVDIHQGAIIYDMPECHQCVSGSKWQIEMISKIEGVMVLAIYEARNWRSNWLWQRSGFVGD